MGESASDKSPSQLIDGRIAELGDWRGAMLAHLRGLIRQADPDGVEDWKWRGVPVWSHDGIICTGETYREVVKLTFARGAALDDPQNLFNASLDGNVRRAIDLREGETIDAAAFQALVRAAVALNTSRGKRKSSTPARWQARRFSARRRARCPIVIYPTRCEIAAKPGRHL